MVITVVTPDATSGRGGGGERERRSEREPSTVFSMDTTCLFPLLVSVLHF